MAVDRARAEIAPPEPPVAVEEPSETPRGKVSERIKASVTVLEFVSRYVDLEPVGSGALGLCPFHDDHPQASE